MDREAIRALNRERVRMHREQRAGVQELMEHRFLRRFSKPTSQANSSALHTIESSDDESGSEVSRTENARNQETMDSDDTEIKANIEEVNVQAGPGFDFEEFVSKLKTSPASSVKSNTSWKQYTDQPIPLGVPSAIEQVRSTNHANNCYRKSQEVAPLLNLSIVAERLLESTDLSQDAILPDIATATGSNVLQLIFEGIQKLTYEQQQLTMAVNRINATLECLTSNTHQNKREPFEKKYKLQLPYMTRKDFLKFDENLAKDEQFRAALVFSLIQKYDTKKTITKNITAVLRKYMTRDVALLYTAQKAVGGKALFKETALSACLLETIDTLAEDKVIAPVPDNEYLANLGSVLSNAKDWGVPRHERRAPKRQRT